MAKVCSENQILHNILQSGCIDTHSKRKVIIQKNLNVVQQKKIYLGQNSKKENCYIAYNNPSELLQRFFEDTSVKNSFNCFSREKHDSNEKDQVYGDFLKSNIFHQIQGTLSAEESKICNNIPLCIGLYR